MSIRPVEMLTMLPRLNEASRQQHHTDVQPFVAQHAATLRTAEKAVRDQQTVQQKSPSEQAEIRRDGRRSDTWGGGQKRSHREEPEPSKEPAQPLSGRGNRLDVRV